MLMIAANADKITPDEMNQDFGWGGGSALLDAASMAKGDSRRQIAKE